VGELLHRLKGECKIVVLADPRHIGYISGFFTNPATLSLRSQSFLVIEPGEQTTLITDTAQAEAARLAHANSVETFVWYDETAPRRENHRLASQTLLNVIHRLHLSSRSIGVELGALPSEASEALRREYPDVCFRDVWDHLLDMRLCKWPDEVECAKRAIRACEAGYAAVRHDFSPGMTEMDLYATAFAAALREAGEPIVAGGDFISGPDRTADAAGPPTRRVIRACEPIIMDFFIFLGGYRADLCNTFVAGGQPSPVQQRRFEVLEDALAAAEELLRPGTLTLDIYQAVERVIAEAGLVEGFWGHVGHGLGLDHPEAPFIVRHSRERLQAGNLITIEPGVYLHGWGGMRIEDNYLITTDGFERLSHHVKGL
jgi:Xaa-Pro aminopeptidase